MKTFILKQPLLFVFAANLLLIVAATVNAQEENTDDPTRDKIFVDYVSTDLHRQLLYTESGVLFSVHVSSDELPGDNVLNCSHMLSAVKEMLKSVPKEQRNSATFHLHVHSESSRDSEEAIETLGWAFVGYTRFRKFQASRFSTTWHPLPVDMNEKMLTDVEFPELGEEEAAEPETQVGAVRLFPVKTRLSRILTNHSDCIIFIDKTGFDGIRIKDSVADNISSALEDETLNKLSDRVYFSVPFPERMEDRDDLSKTLQEFARQIGFEKSIVQMR